MEPTDEEIQTAIRVISYLSPQNKSTKKFGSLTNQIFLQYKKLSTRLPKTTRLTIVRDCLLNKRRQERQESHKRYLSDPLDQSASKFLRLEVNEPSFEQRSKIEPTFVCYICKKQHQISHAFYGMMCEPCGHLQFQKRNALCQLQDRIAIVTGARIKIGYETAIRLLLSGAEVIATTRFTTDACLRFYNHPQFNEFKNRLHVYHLDLADKKSIEEFTIRVKKNFSHIDILINNAAQTIKRPDSFHTNEQKFDLLFSSHVRQILDVNQQPSLTNTNIKMSIDEPASHEESSVSQASSEAQIKAERRLEVQTEAKHAEQDEYGQPKQIGQTSWHQDLLDVTFEESMEAYLINAAAPLMLIKEFLPIMQPNSHIINVSSMEGSFSRFFKTSKHVHTNMAKAALNMITRTLANRLAEQKIYMNSVDTGWIDNMTGKPNALIPLDIEDGAARIVDVIFEAQKNNIYYGSFLKDYKPTNW